MDELLNWIPLVGAIMFGAVVGWMTHSTFDTVKEISVTSFASIVGVIGGGAVTAIFKSPPLFGAYCIGLGLAFFLRVLTAPVARAISEEMRADQAREEERRALRRSKVGN